jgi:hypothetical protein
VIEKHKGRLCYTIFTKPESRFRYGELPKRGYQDKALTRIFAPVANAEAAFWPYVELSHLKMMYFAFNPIHPRLRLTYPNLLHGTLVHRSDSTAYSENITLLRGLILPPPIV